MWAAQQNSIDEGVTHMELVVQGNTDANVYVSKIRAQIIAESPNKKGILINCATQGEVTPVAVAIHLDTNPNAVVSAGQHAPFGYTVNKTDTEVFNLSVFAQHRDYRWNLAVDTVVAGKPATYVVTNRGQPFETTGYSESRVSYSWLDGEWEDPAGRVTQLPSDGLAGK